MKMSTRAPVVPDEAEMARMWKSALRVWECVPVRAQGTPEFNDALLAFGCEIRDDRISFPPAAREKALERIAQAREANGPWHPAEVTDERLEYATSGQELYICHVDTDRPRAATVQDQADWSRLCDHFYPPLQRAHPTFIPQDVPAGSCDVHAFATIILNSSRPWRMSV